MFAILKRELRSYFHTPQGYIFMGTFLLISGVLFTVQNLFMRSPRYSDFLGTLIMIFTLVIPLLTMRVFSEEKKNRTDQLLLTAPVTPWAIAVGKFLAPLTLFFFTMAVTFLYPLILSFHGNLESAKIIGTYLGFFLLGASFISLGVFISSVSENQVSSALLTLCAILFIWLIDFILPILPSSSVSGAIFLSLIVLLAGYWVYRQIGKIRIPSAAAGTGILLILLVYILRDSLFQNLISRSLEWISLTARFVNFPLGILSLGDMVFYLSFSLFFLFLTGQRLEKQSWSKRG